MHENALNTLEILAFRAFGAEVQFQRASAFGKTLASKLSIC